MSTTAEKNELKIEGVVESAQDPDTSTTADDAQQKILEESRRAGVAAFTFDPDASLEEKKRQARAVSPGLSQLLPTSKTPAADNELSLHFRPSPKASLVNDLMAFLS